MTTDPGSRPARGKAGEAGPARSRRRGAKLEDALLEAVWDELAAVGYANLTMEGAAARAGTSKAVLYRRWPNRAELVRAAMRRRVGSIAEEIPDTGDLRGDTLAVLRGLRRRYQLVGPDIMHGLMTELHQVPREVFDVVPGVMMAVLRRAAERGEARPERVTPRVAALPGDLLRHELLISHTPASDAFLAEVTDEVFLPLVRTAGRRPAGEEGGR
jgi:AcrR family transcriptional regulator